MANLAQVLELIEKHDKDYEVRYVLVWRAVALALGQGYAAGVRIDPADPEWPVVYIELPTGQCSWHMPQHPAAWDGHDTAEKYRRIREFVAGAEGTSSTKAAAEALKAEGGREVLDEHMAHFQCLVVMTGGCTYFTDGVHRCTTAPLGDAPVHGTTTEHPHSCACRTRWATVRSAGE